MISLFLKKCRPVLLLVIIVLSTVFANAQFRPREVYWTNDGTGYFHVRQSNILQYDLETGEDKLLIPATELTPEGREEPLSFNIYTFSPDGSKLLIFTNTAKVWRYNTRGDYWVYDAGKKQLFQLGKDLPAQSLMYAKLSPDGAKAAYVSGHNIYVEDLSTHAVTALTTDGTRKLINGTFDWVYEEEFGCRDGFRWSPDGKKIAFWQVDARKIRDYYMINTTDSPYSQIIPVEYPKVGEPPSPVRIGVITLDDKQIKWMQVPGDPQQHYIPRMEWAHNSDQLVLQQLNRKQNESKLFFCDIATGEANNFYTENDEAFIDIKARWNDNDPTGWEWLHDGKDFLWVSEKDGWRHIYLVDTDGKETLLTVGDYDIAGIAGIGTKNDYVYFSASPKNPIQLYLFRVKMDGKSTLERVTPEGLSGTHEYNISPNARYARHSFSNYKTFPGREWIAMKSHQPLIAEKSIKENLRVNENSNVEYFRVTTIDGITLDGWMVKPVNFDSTKKYPVVFYVYGEPAASTVTDHFGGHRNFLFNGDLSIEGYFQISVDNRGTPSLRGRKWRKSIYRKLGRLNIRDQAMAAKEILKKPWFDTSRVAVWGWSGGGSSTLNLMFQYPEIYNTGIAIAAVTNLLYYDNIYEERYMGLPQENREDYVLGSPIHYAQNLQGHLLYIHGTGDDNVHYDNAEKLVNVLVKYGKQFQFMPYPNRTHSLSEGKGTFKHLRTLYSNFLRRYCPPGGE